MPPRGVNTATQLAEARWICCKTVSYVHIQTELLFITLSWANFISDDDNKKEHGVHVGNLFFIPLSPTTWSCPPRMDLPPWPAVPSPWPPPSSWYCWRDLAISSSRPPRLCLLQRRWQHLHWTRNTVHPYCTCIYGNMISYNIQILWFWILYVATYLT